MEPSKGKSLLVLIAVLLALLVFLSQNGAAVAEPVDLGSLEDIEEAEEDLDERIEEAFGEDGPEIHFGDEGMEFDDGDADGFDPGMMGEDFDPSMFQNMMGGGGVDMDFGGPSKVEGVKSDVKYILCDTCKALVRRAVFRTEELRKEFPNTPLTEDRIDDALETLCSTNSPEGKWITEYDMVEEGDHITLKRQPTKGKCKEECKTIEMACEKLYGEFGPDLVAKLWKNDLTKDELTELMCSKWAKKMKGSCAKPKRVPETRQPNGDNFEPLSGEELAMDDLNARMKEL